ncbi:MAG: hypothetical protein PHI67_03585 [Candidatus Methanomethylophilaceae archaeon]|nr:hypothetical protein [Candidatus Methanomethylophilaceae archaeon]
MPVINRLVWERNVAWNPHDVEKIAGFCMEGCTKEDIALEHIPEVPGD